MAAIQALVLFMNMMFGGSSNLTADQQQTLIASPEYQSAISQNPDAVSIQQSNDQVIVIIDQNEL